MAASPLRHGQPDPLALASALSKLERAAEVVPAQAEPAAASLFIVNPFGALGGLVRLFSTHPPAEERIRRLRAMSLGPVAPPRVARGPRPRARAGVALHLDHSGVGPTVRM